jgi:hypothetical protein
LNIFACGKKEEGEGRGRGEGKRGGGEERGFVLREKEGFKRKRGIGV